MDLYCPGGGPSIIASDEVVRGLKRGERLRKFLTPSILSGSSSGSPAASVAA